MKREKIAVLCVSSRMSAPWSFVFHTIMLWFLKSSTGYGTRFQNETDRQALLAFKKVVTLDPHGIFNSWNTSAHYCNWQGISCSSKHRERVTILDLSSLGLVGSLSPYMGNLSFLRIINLQNNSFQGEIPSEFGQLHRLRIVYLNNNSFLGEVPTNLTGCRNLRELNLIDNNLAGKLPVHLSSLPKLAALGLGQNNFRGDIPPSLGNFSTLVLLSLTEARLEGSIPEDLGRLTELQYLIMADNNLTGSIPSSIYNLSNLIIFSVASNKLQGNLPVDIGFTLPKLQQLALGENSFSGAIPLSLSNASHLQLISFTNNRFSGPIPRELGRLLYLSWIGLSGNMLGTTEDNDLDFVSYLTNCTRLERLFIGGNFLRGRLPHSIANLSTEIRYLSLGINQIYGTIPSEIGNLVNLNLLDMQYLMLSGNIPSTVGNLQQLLQLYLPGNRLSGPIPTFLGNLTHLYDLQLRQNNLSGKIPPSLGNCQKLQKLDLSHNNISDQIPSSLFSLPSVLSINLSHNSLAGSLLIETANLIQLESLDVSDNKLSGNISNMLGSCLSLESLRMNGNFFRGMIPRAFHSLRGLQELDLSRNELSGEIPDYLGELPFLQNLNLSFNELEGAVPEIGIFRNASAVALVGNKKLCGGISALKLQACPVKEPKKSSFSLKMVIPIIMVAVCLTLLAGFFIICYKRNKSKEKSLSASFSPHLMKISYGELLRATDAFSEANLIGVGSYGSVYKGILHPGESIIAVKVLNLQQRGASKSFTSECIALRSIRHRNLLKILSVCSSVDYQGNDFRAVIYEFMPNGSLENWLHLKKVADPRHEVGSLSFVQRLSIAIDVASAIEYLHCHCQTPIIHSDLKPSNVLLDENMVAHVGDFGLAKVLSTISSGSLDVKSSLGILKGSVGYVAPEYGMSEQVSIQGDIYSYGILLLELLTAKRPTDDMFEDGMNLHNFTRRALPDQVMDIVDPHLLLEEMTEKKQECLISVLRVGVSCSMETPRDRMEIRDVVKELHLIKKSYEGEG